jgi:hypothetical protein
MLARPIREEFLILWQRIAVGGIDFPIEVVPEPYFAAICPCGR